MEETKPEIERLSADDLMMYKDALHKSMQSVTNAEKARAQAEAAQAEAKYVVLSIYLKNNLRPGKDEISEDGRLFRKSEDESPPAENEKESEG